MKKMFFKIGFNTLIQIGGKGLSVIFGLISVFLITRYLGTSGYGNFVLAFTFVSFFSIIADFGLGLLMVRDVSSKEVKKQQFGNYLFLKTVLIIISSVLAMISLLFFPYSNTIKIGILIALLAVGVSGITNYGSNIFQSKVRIDLITYIDVITKIISVIFIIVFILLKLNLYFIIGSVLIGNLVGLATTYFLLKEHFFFSFNKKLARQILVASFPLGFMTLLGTAYFKIDTIMLSVLKNTSEVGLYSVSYKVLENFLIIWGFYMASVYPLFASLAGKKDYKSQDKLLKNSFLIALGISALIIIVGYIFAPFIINVMAGKEFSQTVYSLRIILFSLPFLFINNLLSDYCISIKKNKFILVGIFFSLIFNILLNLLLIPKYGYIGASYVTVFSAIFLSIYSILTVMILKFHFGVSEK